MMDDLHRVILPVLGIMPCMDQKKFNDAVASMKAKAKIVDTALKGKNWLVGNNMTVADLYVGGLFMTLV